jgi:hypothetical protein
MICGPEWLFNPQLKLSALCLLSRGPNSLSSLMGLLRLEHELADGRFEVYSFIGYALMQRQLGIEFSEKRRSVCLFRCAAGRVRIVYGR